MGFFNTVLSFEGYDLRIIRKSSCEKRGYPMAIINIKYGKTYKNIINWNNITAYQFRNDWATLLSGEYNANDDAWNEDRMIVALLTIMGKRELESLLSLAARRRGNYVDYHLLRKALQTDATNKFFYTGKFAVENDIYIDYLNNMALSTAEDGKILFTFYFNNRKKFSAQEHKLFVDHIEKIENEKLKTQILEFISLNYVSPESDQDPTQELMNTLEEQMQALKKEEEEKANNTGRDYQPSVINDSIADAKPASTALFVDTNNSGVKDSPILSPIPLILTSAVVVVPPSPIETNTSWFTKFVNKWKALPTGYKVAAFGVTFLGLVSTILGIVFPPSLTVTVPLLKISSSALLTYGGAVLTTACLVGHAVHISRQPVSKTKALPISTPPVADDNLQQPAAPVIEPLKAELALTPSPSHISTASTRVLRHSDSFIRDSDAEGQEEEKEQDIDTCGSSQLGDSRDERDDSLSRSSRTILSMLKVPTNTPISSSPSTSPLTQHSSASPSNTGRSVLSFVRSNSTGTAISKSSKARVATISPRLPRP
jgi:hypothetical protein